VNLTRVGYRDLLAAGIRIHEWDGADAPRQDLRRRRPPDPHRIDQTSTTPPSSGNWELDVLIDDPGFARGTRAPVPPRHQRQPRGWCAACPRGPGGPGWLPVPLDRADVVETLPHHSHSFRERRPSCRRHPLLGGPPGPDGRSSSPSSSAWSCSVSPPSSSPASWRGSPPWWPSGWPNRPPDSSGPRGPLRGSTGGERPRVMDALTDPDLARRAAAGDAEAFGALVEQWTPAVRRVTRARLGGPG